MNRHNERGCQRKGDARTEKGRSIGSRVFTKATMIQFETVQKTAIARKLFVLLDGI
jgi:hypothetical protein